MEKHLIIFQDLCNHFWFLSKGKLLTFPAPIIFEIMSFFNFLFALIFLETARMKIFVPSTSHKSKHLSGLCWLLTHFSPVLHFIKKPVIWFALQIKWLVSIWHTVLGWNGLKRVVYSKTKYRANTVKHTHILTYTITQNNLDLSVFFYLLYILLKT